MAILLLIIVSTHMCERKKQKEDLHDGTSLPRHRLSLVMTVK